MLAGGFSHQHHADESIQNIINQVREDVESQIGDVGEYQAIKYTTQVVAGTNYWVKVLISGDQYIHIKVFVPLPHTGAPPSLSEVQIDKTADDHL